MSIFTHIYHILGIFKQIKMVQKTALYKIELDSEKCKQDFFPCKNV